MLSKHVGALWLVNFYQTTQHNNPVSCIVLLFIIVQNKSQITKTLSVMQAVDRPKTFISTPFLIPYL
jgi:hypothetical protein